MLTRYSSIRVEIKFTTTTTTTTTSSCKRGYKVSLEEVGGVGVATEILVECKTRTQYFPIVLHLHLCT